MGLENTRDHQWIFEEFLKRHYGDETLRTGIKSEPNSRSGSLRYRKKQSALIGEDCWNSSKPLSTKCMCRSSLELSQYQKRQPKRIRSFRTSRKGVTTATEGDRRDSDKHFNCRKNKEQYQYLNESKKDKALYGGVSTPCVKEYFRVCVMGAEDVGKRTLVNQFTSSDVTKSNVFEIEESNDTMLSVIIDNEESTVEFVEFTEQEDRFPVDAYTVVFSVHERQTYETAIRYLKYIRNEKYNDRPIILVANKIDLVRKRQVNSNEAKNIAMKFHCKYIETSATLNLKVDELLVGIMMQIRLKLNPEMNEVLHTTFGVKYLRSTKTFLNKLLHLKPKAKRSTGIMN